MERDWRCDVPEQRLVWAQATSEALKIIEGKWKTIILCQLFAAKAPLRFSELERRIEGINQKMLIQQLKQLEKMGLYYVRFTLKSHLVLNTPSRVWE
nr:Redox-sensing transcriptional regulator QorR [Raoultella sp. NCTC 9187]